MSSEPTLQNHVTHFETGEPVSGCGWIKNNAVFVLGDGRIASIDPDNQFKETLAKPNSSFLVSAETKNALLAGGDDGQIIRISDDLTCETIAGSHSHSWIDALTARMDGSFAFSIGKKVTAIDAKGRESTLDAPSSVRGLAFSPKGYRLAIAHYNGVSLWYPGTKTEHQFLEWKGSHLDVTWSPDARFVISTMQENSLHVFRLLPTKIDLRMSHYPSKIRSLSWTADGKWLATSGADCAILWPFETADGPASRRPEECGLRPARVSQVAAHPQSTVLAIGYNDGGILLVRLSDKGTLIVQPGNSEGEITSLKWDKKGENLAFGTSLGLIGVLRLPG